MTVEGPNADSATVLEAPGQIEITPGETRQAIAYRVTNEEDDLSAMAFILVPEAVDDDFADPPEIDPDLPVQYVGMNETREWNLEDILVIPSGRDGAHLRRGVGEWRAVQRRLELRRREHHRFTPPTGLPRPRRRQLHRVGRRLRG